VRRPDEKLLAAAREGDEAAFHELIDRHAEGLFRLAFRLVGDTMDAEDVVQEALMGAFEHLGRFEGRSTIKTWLTRILLRQAARCHRRRARHRAVSFEQASATAGDGLGVPAGESPSDDANRRLDVHRALQRISPDHREAVVLREFEGMSYAEMAEVLGVPQGTVESRLHRARQALRELLQGYLP